MTLVVRRDFREFKRALPQAGVALLVFLAVVLPWIVNLNTVGGWPATKSMKPCGP